MDWTNLPTMKYASEKKLNRVHTVTDRGSRQAILILCLRKDTVPQVAKEFLRKVVRLPWSILTDMDTKFSSVFWRSLCDLMESRSG